MDRRAFIATTAGALGFALGGCVEPSGGAGRPTESDPTQRNTSTASPSARSPGSPTDSLSRDGVVVDDIVVRKAVAYESYMGSGGVFAEEGRQYVVASVRADHELSDSEFTFESGDETWDPGLPTGVGSTNYAVAGYERSSTGRDGDGYRSYLAFSVPSPLSASNPRIRRTGSADSEWALSSTARERLAASAPRFELEALETPSEVSQGDPLAVSLTVRNVSETDGRFLAAVYWPTKLIADDDESSLVERRIAAGGEATASLEIDTDYTTNEPEAVTLSLRGHVTAEREIRVRDASTPA